MSKNFTLTVYLKDDSFTIPFWAGDMLQLTKDLRDFSFIRIGDKYLNKMHIIWFKFSDEKLLDIIVQCVRRSSTPIEEEIRDKYDK